MTTTTLSSREFTQNICAATKAADQGPVFITERGRPVHVLLSIDAYQRLIREHRNMAELLSIPDMADIEFEPIRSSATVTPADFSCKVSGVSASLRRQ